MLAAKADDDKGGEADSKPEWLGDFESPEEMAKAYKELRTKMSEGKKPDAETDKKVEEQAAEKGVDLSKYAAEWGVNQGLSDESYAELAEAGYSKDIVDNYIAGKMATVASETGKLYDAVGGEEAYAELIEWGKSNIPTHSQEAYDRLLNAGEYEAAALALRGFVQDYQAAVGTDPKASLNPAQQSGATGGAQPFGSKSDMIAAINDPRYKNGDRSYIAQVEKRILASRF
jgi:hypothetical protein